MNKEKLIISMKERIDLLNNSLREYSSKLYELEDWIIRLERGEFDE